MYNHDVYTIPFRDKYIVYQPLNRFAFIGNKAIVNLIGEVFNRKEIDPDENREALSFLSSHGFFNKHGLAVPRATSGVFQPTVAVLCMTSACNFRCSYCFAAREEENHEEIPVETGKRAIDIACSNAHETGAGSFTVSFHGGGEPTLPFNKLKELTAHARRKEINCIIELTSNGYWEEAKAGWIISNTDNITLSFDGISDIQNMQRPLASGNETFKTVMKNIMKLDTSGSGYGIRMTVTRYSVSRLSENIEFIINNTGCSTIQVEPSFGTGRAKTNNLAIKDNRLFVEQFMKARDIASHHERNLYYSGARPWINTASFCTAHQNALVVTPGGLLSSCYEISWSGHPLAELFHFGKITPGGELEIEYSKRKKLEKLVNERKESCRTCFCYWHCAGDCPAKIILPSSFDINPFPERCDVNREITKQILINYLIENDGVYKT